MTALRWGAIAASACTAGLLAAAAPAPAAAPLPSGWPRTLQVGLADGPGGAARLRASAPFGFRYQYLAGGVNTGDGWSTWNEDGSFVTRYVEESAARRVRPVFSYYMLRQSLPGRDDGDEPRAVLGNLRNRDTMRAWFSDLRLLFERTGATGRRVVVQVEPDLWGYAQQVARDDVASTVPAAVSGTGLPELAGLPDDVAGLAQAVVRLRDRLAPRVTLGWHVSVWGTGVDVSLANPSAAEVDRLAGRAAAFHRSLGAPFDVVFAEFDDRDSGFNERVLGDGGASWWTRADFARHVRFLGRFSRLTRRRLVLWQIPLGNRSMQAMDNTWGHYQDNRVEWLLGAGDRRRAHLRAYRRAGVAAFLFGGGADGTTCACDARGDGVTNPPPIGRNRRRSLSADDDGGLFRSLVRRYYRRGALRLARR